MSDPKAMIDRAQAAWQAADVDGWLALFTPNAKFFVPGATSGPVTTAPSRSDQSRRV